MPSSYDAIVVGARCAGSSTAMLLARAGHRVLLLDRASFPSDTMSTHLVHPPGVAALERWGLLDQLVASGCPPIGSYRIDFGPFAFAASPRPAGTIATAYAPRRTVLDKLLVDAAVAAGAELREGCTVEEVLVEDGTVTGVRVRSGDGATATERAAVVVGADGLHSTVPGRSRRGATTSSRPWRRVTTPTGAVWRRPGSRATSGRSGPGRPFLPTRA
jgi:2-polyprenyl-6-methoxyphenol hydroxylase-like FAD-dependent oxidoreductase